MGKIPTSIAATLTQAVHALAAVQRSFFAWWGLTEEKKWSCDCASALNELQSGNALIQQKEGLVDVHFDGNAYHRLCEKIQNAKTRICIHMFIWKNDTIGRRVAQLLTEAADRGVSIHIFKDAIGDIFELWQDFLSTKTSEDDVWRPFWSHKNISVHYGNFHDHSKVFFIDDILFVGSMNIGEKYCTSWRECFVELPIKQHPVTKRRKETAGENTNSVHVLHGNKQHPMRDHVRHILQNAKTSILIVASYFSDPECVDILARKSTQGVTVQIIIPDHPHIHHHANLTAISKLLAKGEKKNITVYTHASSLLHSKILIVDSKAVFVGSTNFIRSSLSHMGETNILFKMRPSKCLQTIEKNAQNILKRSRKMTHPPQRKWMHQALGMLQL